MGGSGFCPMKKLLLPFLLVLSLPVFADEFREQLIFDINEYNKKVPQDLGDYRIESVALINNTILYTMKIQTVKRSEFGDREISLLQQRIFNMGCTNPTTKSTIDAGYTYEYKYFDKDSKYLVSIPVTSADCENI